ncbi:hypothetical protein [Edaphobacter modestus]|uniref:hypothetical protein n=1 Tax=Edaphobacter modestus TaxID=388466 RepID=UPI0013EEA094|nr:hypothetical protein [Edaphobacter modestus]
MATTLFERPIAKQEHLIGRCELEPGKRRAPGALLAAAQRFRILQRSTICISADLAVCTPST